MASLAPAPVSDAIIRKVPTAEAARNLPAGSIVGDHHGGVTFTDAVAAILESRSRHGWKEIEVGAERWTVIAVDR